MVARMCCPRILKFCNDFQVTKKIFVDKIALPPRHMRQKSAVVDGGAERRVKCVQTRERGPPLAPEEFKHLFFFLKNKNISFGGLFHCC